MSHELLDEAEPPVGPTLPVWAQELDARLAIDSQAIITGNVGDSHLTNARRDLRVLHSTTDVIKQVLVDSGFEVVLRWNPVTGPEAIFGTLPQALGDLVDVAKDRLSLDRLRTIMTEVVYQRVRSALVLDFLPRAAADEKDLNQVYLHAGHLAEVPRHFLDGDKRPGLRNMLIWTADRETEFPHWLTSADTVHVISIPLPTHDDRRELARLRAASLPGFPELPEADRRMVVDLLAATTDGMSLNTVVSIVQLAITRGIAAQHIEEAVRFVRSARQRSPWQEHQVRDRIAVAADRLAMEVLGQERAIGRVSDVLARAALGLSGASGSSHPTRPQGVLFLAGPTGVGKTEVAKQIAKLVFGQQEAMIRFDMSEFNTPHSESRLIGAPPGYAGHGAGGELTNAVRARPFSLLLFDEIDKANNRILDKFLQILDDGRLTDGSGNTVYFTETLIVFTSNLGVPIPDQNEGGGVPTTRPEDLTRRILQAIRRHFLDISRPELLNRIGDNIVVFDHIDDKAARAMLARQVDAVCIRVRQRTGHDVRVSHGAQDALAELVVEPGRLALGGGRVVASVIESHLVNPLARKLLTLPDRSRLVVERISTKGPIDLDIHVDGNGAGPA